MYELVWTSQYGTEVIDEADDRKTAQYLRREYLLAFGEGSIVIKRTAKCAGVLRNGPQKRFVRCNKCERIDYEGNEGDRCSR
jgi:hypothetical protein